MLFWYDQPSGAEYLLRCSTIVCVYLLACWLVYKQSISYFCYLLYLSAYSFPSLSLVVPCHIQYQFFFHSAKPQYLNSLDDDTFDFDSSTTTTFYPSRKGFFALVLVFLVKDYDEKEACNRIYDTKIWFHAINLKKIYFKSIYVVQHKQEPE